MGRVRDGFPRSSSLNADRHKPQTHQDNTSYTAPSCYRSLAFMGREVNDWIIYASFSNAPNTPSATFSLSTRSAPCYQCLPQGWRMRGTARPNVCAASGAAAKPLFHMPFAFFMCFPSGYENTVLYMTAAYRGEGFRLSKMGRICRGKRFGNSICYTSRRGRRS